jgi:hypothetical protein
VFCVLQVEALAVKLTQNEGELIHDKFEVKKLASFLKKASDDAKKLVNQEKSFACAEIESARALVMKLGGAFEEQELCSKASRDQGPNVEKLVEEVQEARRIRRLHKPTMVQLHFCALHKFSIIRLSISFISHLFDNGIQNVQTKLLILMVYNLGDRYAT